tara:strand:- start:5828 stop:6100 length:273 start_codon:yes stop_codon:yes gene_type:complete
MFQADFPTRLSLSGDKNLPEVFCENDVINSEPRSFFEKDDEHAFSAFAIGKPMPILPIEQELVECCYGYTKASINHNKTSNRYVSKAVET